MKNENITNCVTPDENREKSSSTQEIPEEGKTPLSDKKSSFKLCCMRYKKEQKFDVSIEIDPGTVTESLVFETKVDLSPQSEGIKRILEIDGLDLSESPSKKSKLSQLNLTVDKIVNFEEDSDEYVDVTGYESDTDLKTSAEAVNNAPSLVRASPEKSSESSEISNSVLTEADSPPKVLLYGVNRIKQF